MKLSQTFAILKYLGRKHGLSGSTEEEVCRVDLIEAEAMDIRTKWSQTVYSTDFVSQMPQVISLVHISCKQFIIFLFQEKLKDDFIKNFVLKLKEVSNFLGDRLWFAGNKVICHDLSLWRRPDMKVVLFYQTDNLCGFLDVRTARHPLDTRRRRPERPQ